MSFMEKQIVYDRWVRCETSEGTEYFPADLLGRKTCHPKASDCRDYIRGSKFYSAELADGYGARLSAPGCLDCTDWAVFETETEARDFLDEMYTDDKE